MPSPWSARSDPGAGVEALVLCLRLRDLTVCCDAAGEPHVAADRRAAPDRHPLENRGAGVDGDVVFDDRMPRPAFDGSSYARLSTNDTVVVAYEVTEDPRTSPTSWLLSRSDF